MTDTPEPQETRQKPKCANLEYFGGRTCEQAGQTYLQFCWHCLPPSSSPREPQKDETPKCPECSGRMLRVRNNSEFINNDQFDAIKRGDWFCVGQSVFAPKAAKHEAVYVWEEPREPHAALIAEYVQHKENCASLYCEGCRSSYGRRTHLPWRNHEAVKAACDCGLDALLALKGE